MCVSANSAAKHKQTYRETTGTEGPGSSLCMPGAFMYEKWEKASGSFTLFSARTTERQKAPSAGMISNIIHTAKRLWINTILPPKPTPVLDTTMVILLGYKSDHSSPNTGCEPAKQNDISFSIRRPMAPSWAVIIRQYVWGDKLIWLGYLFSGQLSYCTG